METRADSWFFNGNAEDSPVRLRVQPIRMTVLFAQGNRFFEDERGRRHRREIWRACYSYEKGSIPKNAVSAVVAGPRFLKSQTQGPDETFPRNMRRYDYLTQVAKEVTTAQLATKGHSACTGYIFCTTGKSRSLVLFLVLRH